MSDRLTSVRLRKPTKNSGFGNGLAEWGRLGRSEMIAKLREHAEREKAHAEEILAAADEDFIVETYLGPHAMHKLEEVVDG